MKVAYLGPEKTYTHQVAIEIFPEAQLIPILPIRRVVKKVELGETDYGVIPLENLYEGEVRETLDALTESNLVRIVQEKAIEIHHFLGALPKRREITQILSKDQALGQCSRYLCNNYPEANLISTSSTAEAALRIKNENLLDAAAIASHEALLKANLEIIANDDEICPNNRTRFIVVGKNRTNPTKDDKTMLAIHPPVRDKSGVLSDILGIIAGYDINLEDIESRPDGQKGYIFYIELNGHRFDTKVLTAIRAIKSRNQVYNQQDALKILGSYPNTHWKDK